MNPPCRPASSAVSCGTPGASGFAVWKSVPFWPAGDPGPPPERFPVSPETHSLPAESNTKIIPVSKKACQYQFVLHRGNNFLIIRNQRERNQRGGVLATTKLKMDCAPQPAEGCYSRNQVLRILGLSDRQLAAWERQGLVEPRPGPEVSGAGSEPTQAVMAAKRQAPPDKSPERPYTFSDIVSLRTLLHLRREGVPPARIRSFHAALKAKLAGVERPWSELQVQKRGRRLLVHFQGAALEPITGQLLLVYAPKDCATTVRKLERPERPAERGEAGTKLRAGRFFRAGLRYEERAETLPKAIRAYQKAIELDPRAAGAWVNLGTLYYNLGQLDEAERCYRAVLSLDPNYALAHFNLANVFDERKQWQEARRQYEEAVRLGPNSPDPHYNLALVYEKLGLHGKARRQWLDYLKLDPHSQWAAYARQQLARTSLRVVSRQESSPRDV